MLAANQATVTKAFIAIVHSGQPESEPFLPALVFSEEHIAIASRLCAFASIVALLLVLLPSRDSPTAKHILPNLPGAVKIFLFAYFAAVILSTKTIFQGAWTDNERQVYVFDLGGLHVLLMGLLIYFFATLVRRRAFSPGAAIVALFVTCTLSHFLKGTTGIAAGTAATGAFVFFDAERRVLRRTAALTGTLLLLFLTAATIRAIRSSVYDEGATSLSHFAEVFVGGDSDRPATGQAIEDTANGTQYASHMLECITLWEQGVSREWRSIYNPIEYTLKPSFLLGLFGLSRSREAAWELGDYFIHGGGIYTLGEYYWNGGYLCVIVVFTLLGLFMYKCDTSFRYSLNWLLMLAGFAPGFLMGQGYGFAQVARGIFNGLWLILGMALLQRLRARRTLLAGYRAAAPT
jgi:hypothetical protein